MYRPQDTETTLAKYDKRSIRSRTTTNDWVQGSFRPGGAVSGRRRDAGDKAIGGGPPIEAGEHPGEGGLMAKSRRVLLVDDDPEIIETMRMVLENKGYDIMIARDGNQGLALAEKEQPDLVVLDMMMPKRSGFLVLERLRKNKKPPRVIMITANEGSRHRAYAEMLGVDEYIRKPFAMDKLVESVGRLLN
jgi:CheY-like chemotaxis protein